MLLFPNFDANKKGGKEKHFYRGVCVMGNLSSCLQPRKKAFDCIPHKMMQIQDEINHDVCSQETIKVTPNWRDFCLENLNNDVKCFELDSIPLNMPLSIQDCQVYLDCYHSMSPP